MRTMLIIMVGLLSGCGYQIVVTRNPGKLPGQFPQNGAPAPFMNAGPRGNPIPPAQAAELSPAELARVREGTTWAGAHHDPLAVMVDWSTVTDPSYCWVGQPPHGWGRSLYATAITNETMSPGVISVDGQIVDVLKSKYAGRGPAPWTYIVTGDNGASTERLTALGPGDTCYLVLPYKDHVAAYQFGWKIRFDSIWERGSPGHHLGGGLPFGPAGTYIAGGSYLYTVPMFRGDWDIDVIKSRGSRLAHAVFDKMDFL